MMEEKQKKELLRVLLKIKNVAFLEKFLEDLLTPRELAEVIKRWQVVKQLFKGIPQRQISRNLGVSIATITRGSRVLQSAHSAFKQILEKKL